MNAYARPTSARAVLRRLIGSLALISGALFAVGCQQMEQPEPPPAPTGTAQVMFVNLALYGGDTARIERPGFQGSGALYADALPLGAATGYHAVPAGTRTHVEAHGQQTEFNFEPDRRYVVTLAGRANLHMTARPLDLEMGDPDAAYLRFAGMSGDFAEHVEVFGTTVPFAGEGIDPNAFQPVTAGSGVLSTADGADAERLALDANLQPGHFYGLLMYESRVGDSRAYTEPALTLVDYGPAE